MGGGCLLGGGAYTGEVSAQGVSAWGCLLMGMSAHGGVCLGGVYPGGCLPGEVYTSPWTEFLTHTCENMTFPQLRLRRVKTHSQERNPSHLNPSFFCVFFSIKKVVR